jgi:hypothetical protein
MSAHVIRFPARRSAAVWILRAEGAWLVVARDHGWVHGDLAAAVEDARWLANNFGLPVRGIPTRYQ